MTSSIKHDWYQTETAVVVTVLARELKPADVNIKFSDDKLSIDLVYHGENANLAFQLSHKVAADQCSYKITPSKVEIKLKKRDGIRWDKLEGKAAEVEIVKEIPKEEVVVVVKEGPPSYPTSAKGKDWNAIEKDLKEKEATEKPEGEEALQKLFQDIYGKGSDEVKKAMNKSYVAADYCDFGICDDDDHYCCGDNKCCEKTLDLWFFWAGSILFVFVLAVAFLWAYKKFYKKTQPVPIAGSLCKYKPLVNT